MAQSWLRTYPLRWLDRSLKFAIIPFTTAKEIRVYATRGYYLLGVLSLIPLSVLGKLGLMPSVFARLPEWMQVGLSSAFGVLGVVSASWMLALALLVIYLLVFAIKPLRLALGELTANLFFGTIDVGIRIGEWCLQHRWSSLFIVIALAGFISWGIYALFKNEKIEHERARQVEVLKSKFESWLDQADVFLEQHPFTAEDCDDYWRTVHTPYWDDRFETDIKPDGGTHPAFVLHEMLDEIFQLNSGKCEFPESLLNRYEQLELYMREYQPGRGPMTDEEKQAWPLMNILMGRVYSRLADLPNEPRGDGNAPEKSKGEYLALAEKYFSLIINQSYKGTAYESAAHNGLGAIYSRVLTPPLKPPNKLSEEAAVCGRGAGLEECANKALAEYGKVEGNTCSYDERRAENNKVFLLGMIGLNYDRLKRDKINLREVCDPEDEGKVGLANCIERHINRLMSCVAYEPFRPVWFATTAQGYAASADLRRGGPPAEAAARAEAAGRYLRLSYALRLKAGDKLQGMRSWGLCFFRFANEDADLSAVFWKAMGREPKPAPGGAGVPALKTLEPLPAPDFEKLEGLIRKAEGCQTQ